MGLIGSVAAGLLANVLFWVTFGALAWLSARGARRRLNRFFGVESASCIRVIASNLYDGKEKNKDLAATLSLHEAKAASEIERLFSSAPIRLPELVRGLVDALWLPSQLRVEILVSPLERAVSESADPAFILGSSSRNSTRRTYLELSQVGARFEREVNPPLGRSGVVLLSGRKAVAAERQAVIVERTARVRGKPVTFFCLGDRADGTHHAVRWLVEHWRELERAHGDHSFIYVLEFRNDVPYPAYHAPDVLAVG